MAHPDDETLWAGGLILAHPDWRWLVATLCRASDPDRAPKFHAALATLAPARAQGLMADLDDGPEQVPLPETLVVETLLGLLPKTTFDLLITHGPQGEYTRHRRHEEVSAAVTGLWRAGRLTAPALWQFAYEDGGRAYLPRPRRDADRTNVLSEAVWQAKRHVIVDVYGFSPESWEARTTPRIEAFQCQTAADPAKKGALQQPV